MMPAQPQAVALDLDPELHADGLHRRGVLQAEVVVDELVGVGQEGRGVVVGRGRARRTRDPTPSSVQARASSCPAAARVRPARRVVPEEALERGVHQRALDGVR